MARRSWLSRFALLGGTLVVALLAAEGLFRAFGPDPGGFAKGTFYTPSGVQIPVAEIANFLSGGGYMGESDLEHPYGRLTPGLDVRLGYDRPRWPYFDAKGCLEVRHNSRGYRDDEFPIEKPKGEFRVLAFGDSFTYGQGVRAEDAWPNLLELALKKQGPAQVVNCGFACGCYTPQGYDDWMQTDGLLLSPDLVVVGLCLNDMEGKPNDVPMLSYPVTEPKHYPSALLEYAVATYEWRMARSQVRDFTAVVRERPQGWEATKDGLRNLEAICDRAGIGLAVAVFPMLSQLDSEPYPYAGLVAMVVDFCREAGIPCVDTCPDFVGRDDEMDLWVHPTDQHPNHIAHRMFADRILGFLREQGLCTPRAKPVPPAPPAPPSQPSLPAALLGKWFFTGSSGGFTGKGTGEPATGFIELRADNTMVRCDEDGTQVATVQFAVSRGPTIFSKDEQLLLTIGADAPMVVQVAADGKTMTLSDNAYDGFGRSYARSR